jgi:CheY-like chemotaxis protein
MNGRDLARRIESMKLETKVLFMSGYTGDETANPSGHGAGVAYLQKPFTPESLVRKVRETLDGPPAAQTILVADDSAPIRSIFSGILTEAGYSVTQASDGPEMRRRLGAGRIGLAFIDLNMPGQEGLEDIRDLKSQHPDVKIVLMSAAFGSDSPDDPQALGVDAVIGKPAQPETLLDTVRRLMAPRAAPTARPRDGPK